MKRNFNYYIKK